ncbi:MAG: cohesin domain-containing protein [Candidatus Diapherotrites archaeon]
MKRLLIIVSIFFLLSAVSASEVSSDYSNGVLTISVSGAEDLYGFQLNVNYNSAALEFVNAEEGGLISGGDSAGVYFKTANTDTPGLLKNFVVTKTGKVPGVNGDGILLKINFKEIGDGDKGLSVSGVKLGNPNAVQSTPTVNPTNTGTGGAGLDLTLVVIVVVVLIIVAAAAYFLVIKK